MEGQICFVTGIYLVVRPMTANYIDTDLLYKEERKRVWKGDTPSFNLITFMIPTKPNIRVTSVRYDGVRQTRVFLIRHSACVMSC